MELDFTPREQNCMKFLVNNLCQNQSISSWTDNENDITFDWSNPLFHKFHGTDFAGKNYLPIPRVKEKKSVG